MKASRQQTATNLARYALAAVFGEREDRWPAALQAAIAAEIEGKMLEREEAIRKQSLEDAELLIRGYVQSHLDDTGHVLGKTWCEDFGCSTLDELANGIRGLAAMAGTGETRTESAADWVGSQFMAKFEEGEE